MNLGICDLLQQFRPIGLKQMNGVEFMNRRDTKYIFPCWKLPALLSMLKDNYHILEINKVRDMIYKTTYLDTQEHTFFNHQAKGKLARHKIRYRTYESTGTTFLEVKRKNNKHRTIKWRIQNDLIDEKYSYTARNFLKGFIPDEFDRIFPVLNNRFTRITLVSLECKERVTIDYGISFSNKKGASLHLPFLAIAELKKEGHTNQSPLAIKMKTNEIRPHGFSKYCIGSALLYDLPRNKAFKPNILLLKKIENEQYNMDL